MFEDAQHAADADGSVLSELFAVAANEFDEAAILAGNRTCRDRAPSQCLYLKVRF